MPLNGRGECGRQRVCVNRKAVAQRQKNAAPERSGVVEIVEASLALARLLVVRFDLGHRLGDARDDLVGVTL
jgi:hypothetical protein